MDPFLGIRRTQGPIVKVIIMPAIGFTVISVKIDRGILV